MEIATDHRPAIGTTVRVTFPGSVGYDTETMTGVVAEHYSDGIDVKATVASDSFDVGDDATIFDSQRLEGVTVEVVG